MKKTTKRIFILFLLIFATFSLVACNKDKNPVVINSKVELTILSINDFHGQLEEKDGSAGAARIAEFIYDTREQNPDNTILLGAGDMFQGTGISNIGYGKDVINFMNMVDFDAMTIGNHEFDWGLNTILAYRDNLLDNGEAEFPFLSTNIYQKSINGTPEGIDEYTIIERSGIKIAIIGYIGYDQASDISASMMADYEFLEPVEELRENIKDARTKDDADVVIVCCHDDSSRINKTLIDYTGEYEVDAIINAHTHNTTAKKIIRSSDKKFVPTIQSSSSGENVGVTTLIFDKETSDVVEANCKNVNMGPKLEKNEEVENFVNDVKSSYAHIFDRELCEVGTKISRLAGTTWAAKALYNYSSREMDDVSIAFINSGGIRAAAFPFNEGDIVTVNDAYSLMPFDNTLIKIRLQGKIIKNVMSIGDVVYSGNITIDNGAIYINNELIKDEEYYTVIVIDFLYDKYESTFNTGIDKEFTGILYRDVLIKEFEIIGNNDEKWLG